MKNFTLVVALAAMITMSCALHFHLQTASLYGDHLESPDANYYFGGMDQLTYYSQQGAFRRQHPETQSCPPSIPFYNSYDGHRSCLNCETIKQGIDLSKAKVLFNLKTRQCQICMKGLSSICEELISGTYFSSRSTAQPVAPTQQTNSSTTGAPNTAQPNSTVTGTTAPNTTATNTTATNTTATNTTATNTTKNTTTTNTTPDTSTSAKATNVPQNASTATIAELLANNCPADRPYYNSDLKICTSCSGSTEFSPTQQKCIPIIYTTSPEATGILLTNLTELTEMNKALQQKYPEQLIQYCPTSKPYSQNNQCINCQQGQYFYITTSACVTGCPLGTYYDARVTQCIPASYYSDVNAHGLISQSGDYETWKAKVEYQAASSPRMVKCPDNKPFQVDGKCINCDNGTYFDIDKNLCVKCGRGREYNEKLKRCAGIIDYDYSMKTFASGVI